jgi:hypothetical protein
MVLKFIRELGSFNIREGQVAASGEKDNETSNSVNF